MDRSVRPAEFGTGRLAVMALAVLTNCGCYSHIVRDDRPDRGGQEIYEPNREPDLVDQLEEAVQQDGRRSSSTRRR